MWLSHDLERHDADIAPEKTSEKLYAYVMTVHPLTSVI